MFWERPSSLHKGMVDSGVYYKECEDDKQVEDLITRRKSMCETENYGRVIKKIQVYNFEKELKNGM